MNKDDQSKDLSGGLDSRPGGTRISELLPDRTAEQWVISVRALVNLQVAAALPQKRQWTPFRELLPWELSSPAFCRRCAAQGRGNVVASMVSYHVLLVAERADPRQSGRMFWCSECVSARAAKRTAKPTRKSSQDSSPRSEPRSEGPQWGSESTGGSAETGGESGL